MVDGNLTEIICKLFLNIASVNAVTVILSTLSGITKSSGNK